MEMIGRDGSSAEAAAAVTNENVASLLRDIRNELRTNNEVLQSMKEQQNHPSPTAPPSSDVI